LPHAMLQHRRASMTLSLTLQIHQRLPLFDQMIVNLYEPGQGITPHIDLLRFEVGSDEAQTGLSTMSSLSSRIATLRISIIAILRYIVKMYCQSRQAQAAVLIMPSL
jgi:hypothetical protein